MNDGKIKNYFCPGLHKILGLHRRGGAVHGDDRKPCNRNEHHSEPRRLRTDIAISET